MHKSLLAIVISMLAAAVGADTRTVTLALPSMDCPVCPITVKKALTQVLGVSLARVDFVQRQAVVVFDDARTNVGALTHATRNAGYPSTLLGSLK